MKKFPVWIFIATFSFIAGIAAVFFLSLPLTEKEIPQPSPICLSISFPGKSIPVNYLNAQTRSIYDSREVVSGQPTAFYSAFQEEIFESAKFRDEKEFPEIATADEIYRFFWLRTFHNPVVIRIYRINDEKFIVVKQSDGRGGYGAGKLIHNTTRKLSDAEWCDFINLLDKSDFWNKEKVDTSHLANDGAMWIMEAIREKRYYTTGEQSPDTGKFRAACIYLMRISGLGIDEEAWEFY